MDWMVTMLPMRRRTRVVLLASALALPSVALTLAAPPVAHAQPKAAPATPRPAAKPANPTKAPSGPALVAVPADKERALKAIKSYSPADKARALRAGGVSSAPPVLSAPSVILSARRPWHVTGAWLDLHLPSLVSGKSDAIWFSSPASYAAFFFNAEGNRHYLVDCQVHVRPNDEVRMIVSGDAATYVSSSVTPIDGHATVIIPKLPRAESLKLRLKQDNPSGVLSWGLNSCEITPA